MKKGFTLVELLITTVIMGMLIGLLFEIFVLIARIAVKVEHERSVHNEIIYVMQTIQNLIDQGNIEFANYAWAGDGFENRYWIDNTINLVDSTTTTWRVFEYNIYTCTASWSTDSGICLSTDIITSWTNKVVLNLTDTERVVINNFYIKVLQSLDTETDYTEIVNDGFWLFMDVEIPEYDETRRWFRVDQKVQTFFNLRKY